MRRVLALAAAGSIALVAPLPASAGAANAGAGAAAVSGWLDVTLREISSRRVNPPRAARILALVSVAMDRACPLGVPAVHGAAAEVLGDLFPDARERFDARAAAAPGSPASQGKGRSVGAAVAARGRADGSDAPPGPVSSPGPDHWQATPPGLIAQPLEPTAGSWRPWNLVTGSELRPGPPPLPGSAQFDRELAEVYDVSLRLSDEQRRIALFWADGAGTETPPGHWNRIALDLISRERLAFGTAARILALLNTAQADAFIAAWDAKYAYWSMRPVTAIRRTLDPEWLPLIVTPPFPAYVSGHSTTSGASAAVLAAAFPERGGDLHAMAREAMLSRLYGGIHFSSDNETGLTLGQAVGAAALGRYDGD